jgi:hypothetical protein
MSESRPLRCQKCCKPVGFVTLSAENFGSQIDMDNVKLTAATWIAQAKLAFTSETINNPRPFINEGPKEND